jgi:hypothetical protein
MVSLGEPLERHLTVVNVFVLRVRRRRTGEHDHAHGFSPNHDHVSSPHHEHVFFVFILSFIAYPSRRPFALIPLSSSLPPSVTLEL